MEPVAQPPVPNFLFHLLDAAKFDSRGPFCLLRRYARANVFSYQHFQVRVNFLVEVRLHTPLPKQIPQQTSRFHKQRHTECPLRRVAISPSHTTAPLLLSNDCRIIAAHL